MQVHGESQVNSISVIIPTYNRTKKLQRALASVFAQTRKPDEVIVVDDGSTDDTHTQVVKNYPQVTYLRQQNTGVSAARNLGIMRAKGNWIALLDSDDQWLPMKLEKQLAEIEDDTSIKIIHTNETWIRNNKQVKQMDKHKKQGGWIFKHCLPLCVISPSSVMLHQSVLNDVGLFDESLSACEDYDLWLRVCAKYQVHYLEEPLIMKYGGHADQLSYKYWGMDRFRIIALTKILSENVLTASDRAAAIDILSNKIDVFSAGAKKRGRMKDYHTYQAIKQRVCGLPAGY